jgi:NAD(P)H-hydrate epimerase
MGVELPGSGSLGPSDLDSLLAAVEGKQALVLGPGIPRGSATAKLLDALLSKVSIPSAIDADGLNALAENPKIADHAKGRLLLTPHPGEASRLLSQSTAQIQADRVAAARALAATVHGAVVLKGARSLIANPEGKVYVNPTGNPGLAKGGTGDVLAGICGALLAQGLAPEDAAVAATYAHGLSADLQIRETGQQGLMASDVIRGLGKVWTRWGR